MNKEINMINDIAKKYIYAVQERGGLEDRGCDSEDFIETSVWSIKKALLEAYNAGKNSK